MCIYFGTCANGHPFQWESSDKLGTGDQRKLHIDNLHFASVIVLSRNSYSGQILQTSTSTLLCFFVLQWIWLQVYTLLSWDNILTEFKDKELVLAGDGRCDSPGNSTKFCTYSVINVNSCTVLHTETIDKRHVELHSPNMEKKAFVNSMDFLLPHMKFMEIITDASSSIWKELDSVTNKRYSPKTTRGFGKGRNNSNSLAQYNNAVGRKIERNGETSTLE